MKIFKLQLLLIIGLFTMTSIFGQYSLSGPTSALVGETHTFTVNGSNVADLTWTGSNGVTISNETYNSADYKFNNSGDTFVYSQILDEFNNIYNVKIRVTVCSTLTGGYFAPNQTICYGESPAIFTNEQAASGGDGSYSYQWQFSNNGSSGWTNISGATGLSYDPPGNLTADRWYRRKVTSCSQIKYSVSRKVTVTIVTWYADNDGDGYGDSGNSMISCTQPVGYLSNSDDYDDSTILITNIIPQTYYKDVDGDGFGAGTETISASFKKVGYASNNSDQCPDTPGADNGCENTVSNLSDRNYIYSRTYQDSGANTFIENVNYFDGLGRADQQVAIGASITDLTLKEPNVAAGWQMDWTEGVAGTAFYNRIGSDAENNRYLGPNPFGQTDLIWECGNDPDSDMDGGWSTDYFNVDISKTYRYVVWVSRNNLQNGNTYHGTENVNNLDGTANGNPYFWIGDLPQLDTWYLLVGVIHPSGYSGGDSDVSGVYDMNGNKVLDGTEFKWDTGTITSRFRSRFAYATDVNARQYFYGPQLEIVDGTELSIMDIVNDGQKRDIVSHVAYDEYGRQSKGWLPYVSNTGMRGSYKTGDIESSIQQYYETEYSSDFQGLLTNEINAYSETEFEASPLNRVRRQAAPGKDWKMDGGHEVRFDYNTNETDEVRLFFVTFNAGNTEDPQLAGGTLYYAANELSKTIIKDENWSSGKNHTTEEFTDKSGRVILRRHYADFDIDDDGVLESEIAHDTYYIYDDFGNLTFVLPPKVDASSTITSNILDDLCYQYKYDSRNRLIEKRLPGKGLEHIVYNNLDQPIMTQDAIQRNNNEWLFTKYDAFGRVAFTGIASGTDRSTEQGLANTHNNGNNWVKQDITSTVEVDSLTIYYSDEAFPLALSISELHTINYYDNYNSTRDGLTEPSGAIQGQTQASNVKGLATVSKVRVLTTNNWITILITYDQKGRSIYSHTDNPFLSTVDIVESELDFTGKVEKTVSSHQRNGGTPIVTTDNFEYDEMARLRKHEQLLAGETEMLSYNVYDGLGQLQQSGKGNSITSPLQTVDYSYNVRGWLTDINEVNDPGDDLFTFWIHYNTPTHTSAVPLYNGNISQTNWATANTDTSKFWYMYHYDALNRLEEAQFAGGGFWDRYSVESIEYDKNGNINELLRRGHTNVGATTFGVLDQLVYTYDSGNKLTKVLDNGNDTYGFVDGVDSSNEYVYDLNGNMVRDLNKGIGTTTLDGITYNYLNLPVEVKFDNDPQQRITYIYDAVGTRLKKVVEDNGTSTTEYAGNYVYQNNSLHFFNHPNGYVTPNGTDGFDYIFQYKDHLGNIRLSYTDANEDGSIDASTEIIEENNYYPFGLQHKGYNNVINGSEYSYKYNSKEHEEELGLNMYDYGARNYDPAIGRWWQIDPLAELMRRFSPYNFAWNNPIFFIDPDGMFASPFGDFFDKNGQKIGTDGLDDGKKYVVTDKKEAKAIKKTDKSSGTTQVSDVSSAQQLPSDAALTESVNVLDRQVANGGLKEEASIVMNDGTVVRSPPGTEPVIEDGESTATTNLPNLPEGTTTADVEATIHSHPTEVQEVGEQVFPHSANTPSAADTGTFSQYDTNIIVGPIGTVEAGSVTRGPDGKVSVPNRSNGVVIYKKGQQPVSLKKKAVQRIIEN